MTDANGNQTPDSECSKKDTRGKYEIRRDHEYDRYL